MDAKVEVFKSVDDLPPGSEVQHLPEQTWTPDGPTEREHILSSDCWCNPRIEVVHAGAKRPG